VASDSFNVLWRGKSEGINDPFNFSPYCANGCFPLVFFDDH